MHTAFLVMADLMYHEFDDGLAEPHDIPGEIPGFREEQVVNPEATDCRIETCHLAVCAIREHPHRYFQLDLISCLDQGINALLPDEYQVREDSVNGGEKKERKCISIWTRFSIER